MSYLDPNKGRQAARAAMRQERIAQVAAARAMVKEAFRDDYNGDDQRRSAFSRLLARLRRNHRGR